jgi:hypothetical protein
MRANLSLKLSIVVVIIFASAVAAMFLWTPLRVRYFTSMVRSSDIKKAVKGIEGLIAIGRKGEEALAREFAGDEDAARILVKSWDNPKKLGTALLYATAKNYGKMANLLIEKGADKSELKVYFNIITVFDAHGMPDIKDKRFVLVDFGPKHYEIMRFHVSGRYALGWLLEENAAYLRVFENKLIENTFYRDLARTESVEPGKYDSVSGLIEFSEYKELNWVAFCNRFLREISGKKTRDFEYEGRSYLSDEALAALYGYWSLIRGHEEIALRLFKKAKEEFSQCPQYETLAYSIIQDIYVAERIDAVCAAKNGFALKNLHGMWNRISSHFSSDNDSDAHRTARLYEQMIEEDRKWKEPTDQEREKMNAAKKARYWIYHLRDLGAKQIGIPGGCSAITGPGSSRNEKPDPNEELSKLGWDAVSTLIDHLDDSRPSRWVSMNLGCWPSSYRLIRNGGYCRRALEKITGLDLDRWEGYEAYIAEAGKESAVKKRAREWWEKVKDKPLKERYIELLVNGKKATERARGADGLRYRTTRKEYMPLIIETMKKSGEATRYQIISRCRGIFTREHIPLLLGFLKEAKEWSAVICTARILWDFEVDEAPHRVIEWYRNPKNAQRCLPWPVLEFLGQVKKDYVFDFVVELLNSKDWNKLQDAISRAHLFPDGKVLDRLVVLAEDKSLTGQSINGFEERKGDSAVMAICRMIKYPKKYDTETPFENRDKFIRELRSYIKKNRENIIQEGK